MASPTNNANIKKDLEKNQRGPFIIRIIGGAEGAFALSKLSGNFDNFQFGKMLSMPSRSCVP